MSSKKKINGSMLQASSKQLQQRPVYVVAGTQQGTNKKKRRPKQRDSNGLGAVSHYTTMLNDPCGSTLSPGFYGSAEGYLARFHKVISPPQCLNSTNAAVGTCGAVLWMPDYTCQGTVTGTAATYNLLQFTSSNPSTNMDISGCTVVKGVGTALSTNSSADADPAYGFVSGSTCGDVRTLSACIKMTYFGQMSTTQGMVGYIDMPFSVFEDRIRGDNMSINGLFEISQTVHRTSLDPVEQKWTPSPTSDIFRGSGSGADPSSISDYCINVNAGSYTVSANCATTNPRVIGFVYRGFASGTPLDSIVQFDCYKNIEWKPQAGSGLTVPTPVRTSILPPSNTAVALLDSKVPGWRTAVHKTFESGASKVAKKALAYSGQLVLKKIPKLSGFLL